MLQLRESGPIGAGGRRLRWLDGVAVVTDGVQLLGDDDVHAAEELLFALPRPDLVVADRCFAGVALNAGFEVVAFADLDAMALAVAAHRGRALRVVPLDERRPPGRLRRAAPASGGAGGRRDPIARNRFPPDPPPPPSCSFATAAPGTYARAAEKRGKRKG